MADLVRLAFPRHARLSPTPARPSRYPLPPEVNEAAVRRLAALALALSVTLMTVLLLSARIKSGWIVPSAAPASYRWSLIAGSVAGILMAGLAIYRILATKPTALTLATGQVFQVFGGLCIALAENAAPRDSSDILRGQTSLTLWIVLFVVAVPTTFGRTLAVALLTATAGPIAHAWHLLAGNVYAPEPVTSALIHGPAFPIAVGAAFLSRYIYRLGAQVSRAREMGSYQLVEMLDRGGMGEVWLARHRLLASPAAIKLIRPDALLLSTPEQIDALARRFEREAVATANLRSPHTVALYDYGITDHGEFYYVMELLEGLDLDKLVKAHGPQPPGRVIHMLLQVCSSLTEAHDRGVVHRDIKPRNILLCRLGASCDFVKVLDFGLAKFREGSGEEATHLTRANDAIGTPAFMAPEAATGSDTVDGRADLYSLGCVAYWLLTGHNVFTAPTAIGMVFAHVNEKPIPLSRRSENPIPAELESIVLACLEKKPDKRPDSARELAARLGACHAARTWSQGQAEEWWKAHAPEKRRELTPFPQETATL